MFYSFEVCLSFLRAKVIIFFLNPETLPEDLNPDNITTPSPSDDAGIDMPGNARGVEAWLRRIGVLSNAGASNISSISYSSSSENAIYNLSGQHLAHTTATGVYIVGGKNVYKKQF